MTEAPAISRSSVVKLARGVRLRKDAVRGQLVLLAPERAMALDETAVRIVQALDGERTLYRIADDFAAEFEAPAEEIANDITIFIQQLAARRMLDFAE
ncbi:coenzyme PQQ biosynthesis protein D [Sinorhizobium fredii USDA 205]|uniref:PqqA binding protein n=1 Tax=Rhizobium fredii TaxID=380 RepID=A0A844A5V5_RHIFR|nr:pyrroloquinoline quinone biosynthesis peptide chaperone PqqD [Sinorhizobium fredii]ASY71741.1 Coenzyme PQQ synthesis protein D [Sinorhizobium fredii CCBAU 83666]KSV87625.1 coenzyme PQQ biosynthesis protein D [Sinorhizobium fredii USDA 205]MQX07897.1 pyrroloquinoline quinone biosynthesis peptide chaperone PqqD [Sinorhizobium fredii]GEC32016.1 pyrroloquinoline quinone biosynthesis protein PqqD [Sinorhizobium fredii]GLS08057.1 pyrroloquinoline quinone biosynthesis protein PqqD [Sinorhizobium f